MFPMSPCQEGPIPSLGRVEGKKIVIDTAFCYNSTNVLSVAWDLEGQLSSHCHDLKVVPVRWNLRFYLSKVYFLHYDAAYSVHSGAWPARQLAGTSLVSSSLQSVKVVFDQNVTIYRAPSFRMQA